MTIEKDQINAWENEYKHLKWGCNRSISHIKNFIPANSMILDAGCGNGRYLYSLADQYNLSGIDISQNALIRAQYYLKKQKKSANYSIASLSYLPFQNDSFNAVICFGVLQHLLASGIKIAINEIYRVLKNNGYIFFEVFGIRDMRFGGEKIEENTFIRQHGILYHYFTKQELELLFDDFEFIELNDKITEKDYTGKKYIRHMISGIACVQK